MYVVLGESLFIYRCLLWSACSSCVCASGSDVTESPGIHLQEHLLFCCVNLRKMDLNLWGRRTGLQVAVSWGGWMAWQIPNCFCTSQSSLCLKLLSSQNKFNPVSVMCFMEGITYLCNLQPVCRLSIRRTAQRSS